MNYSTITSKGQVVIPKKMRDAFNLSPRQRVEFELRKRNGEMEIVVRPVKDILDFVKEFKPRCNKHVDPVKAREYMEKHYENI